MKAHLMSRYEYPSYSITEWWKAEDDNILYVDHDVRMNETIVFPYDMERDRVKSWNELGIWHKDMTGGRAMRELGYEPVEEGKR